MVDGKALHFSSGHGTQPAVELLKGRREAGCPRRKLAIELSQEPIAHWQLVAMQQGLKCCARRCGSMSRGKPQRLPGVIEVFFLSDNPVAELPAFRIVNFSSFQSRSEEGRV